MRREVFKNGTPNLFSGDERRMKYLKVDEYADLKRVSIRTIRNEIKKGRIKAEKIGREYRIPVPE